MNKRRYPADPPRRMDRVTVSQPIVSETTLASNPLGGGVYILVPYLASLGAVLVNITGGVIEEGRCMQADEPRFERV